MEKTVIMQSTNGKDGPVNYYESQRDWILAGEIIPATEVGIRHGHYDLRKKVSPEADVLVNIPGRSLSDDIDQLAEHLAQDRNITIGPIHDFWRVERFTNVRHLTLVTDMTRRMEGIELIFMLPLLETLKLNGIRRDHLDLSQLRSSVSITLISAEVETLITSSDKLELIHAKVGKMVTTKETISVLNVGVGTVLGPISPIEDVSPKIRLFHFEVDLSGSWTPFANVARGPRSVKINSVFGKEDCAEKLKIELFRTLITNYLAQVELETSSRRPRDLSCYPEFVDELLARTKIIHSSWMDGLWFFIMMPVCLLKR